jgi:hypothetical protein
MCDGSRNDSRGSRQLQRLSGSEDQLAHEVPYGFFLLDGKALKLGGSGRAPIQEIVIVVRVGAVNKLLPIILFCDADGSLSLEKLFSVIGFAIHINIWLSMSYV